MSDLTIVIIRVMKTFFVQFFCVFLSPLLISSVSVRSIPFLSFIEPIFAWNISLVSHFFEEVSSLSHSVVFLYLFALITEEGFLISSCYFLELCIQMLIFPFILCFSLLFFSQLFVKPPQTAILLFCISFGGMALLLVSCTMSWTSVHSSSGTLSDLVP